MDDLSCISTDKSTNKKQRIIKNNDKFTFKVEENKIPEKKYKLKRISPDDICSSFFESENSWRKEKLFKILN